jgi:hypothetical protein
MKLGSLETLWSKNCEIYTERQILKALPKMAKAASSPNLQKGSRNICNKPKRRWSVGESSYPIYQ